MASKRKQRSQAAMEFLLTYGWAIIVVLVAIAALAYFGILSPQKLLPDKCFFQVGVQCVDYSVSSEPMELLGSTEPPVYPMSFDLINNLGEDIYITKINVSGPDLDCAQIQVAACEPGTSIIPPGEMSDISLNMYKKCFSTEDLCGVTIGGKSICSFVDMPYEKFLYWPHGSIAGKSFALLTSEHLQIPCSKIPPKGQKTNAVIILEYTKSDPSQPGALRHTFYGELDTSVS